MSAIFSSLIFSSILKFLSSKNTTNLEKVVIEQTLPFLQIFTLIVNAIKFWLIECPADIIGRWSTRLVNSNSFS
ncbi:hypothetical protein ACNQGB_05040 [Flavobacterium sp. XS1P32]|uniref:hypothetical protein n=1 Tax=unclassified Flavobacterium TaxID=196869 RepID=UPI003AAF5D73